MSDGANLGRRIGPYEVQRELGEGGMGRVFLARHAGLDRLVALKVLHRGMAEDEVYLERFRREAKAAAAFQHAHVVGVFASGSDAEAGEHYIVFEFIDGPSLQDLIDGGPVPERRVLEIGRDVLRALRYAEEKGIVHRDVKPDNILITDDGVPKLADLGLAKRFDVSQARVTQTGQIIGTPLYMAPEQALGYTELDGRADLYALGLCLWAALSGKIPFDESGTTSSLQVLSRHINEDLPDVRTRAPEVSADAAAIVAGLAARERDHRYPSAAAALEDVVRVLDGGRAEGVAAPPAADPTGPDPAPAPEPEVVLSGDAATLSKTASTPAWGPPQPTPARVSPVQVVAAAVLGIALTALGLSQLGPSAPPPQPAGPPPPARPRPDPTPPTPTPPTPTEPTPTTEPSPTGPTLPHEGSPTEPTGASERTPLPPPTPAEDLALEAPDVLSTRITETSALLMTSTSRGHTRARELAGAAADSSDPDLHRCAALLERALALVGRTPAAERRRAGDALLRAHEAALAEPQPGPIAAVVDRELGRWVAVVTTARELNQALAEPGGTAVTFDRLQAVPPDRQVHATAVAVIELAELLDRLPAWRDIADRRQRVADRLEGLRPALRDNALVALLDGDAEALPLVLGDVLADPQHSLLSALSNLAPATVRRSRYVEARLVEVPREPR